MKLLLRFGVISTVSCDDGKLNSNRNYSEKIEVFKQYNSHYPSGERYFVKRPSSPNLSIMYDSRTRNPRWALEVLTSNSKDGSTIADRKKMRFYKDDMIGIEDFRVSPTDYTGSGYSRGHLAPAADFQNSRDAMDATFSMANISPQSLELNRLYWAQFEAWVRRLLYKYEEVVVVTGPAFLPIRVRGEWVHIHRTVGNFPKLVEVPTHFFKVILVHGRKAGGYDSRDGDLIAVAAFLMPNQPIDIKTPLETFAVRLRDLEIIVGLRFFEEQLSSEHRKYLDTRAPDLQSLLPELFLEKSDSNQLLPALPTPRSYTSDDDVSDTESVLMASSDVSNVEVIHKPRPKPKKFPFPSLRHLCDDVSCSLSYGRKQ